MPTKLLDNPNGALYQCIDGIYIEENGKMKCIIHYPQINIKEEIINIQEEEIINLIEGDNCEKVI